MRGDSITNLWRVAEELTRHCRQPVLDGLARAEVSLKPDGTVVTPVDVEVQQQLFARLRASYPEHTLIGEEDGGGPLPDAIPGYAWVVDPIDGTRNYAAGFPCFATSIAVLFDGQPVIGVVAEHVTGQLFSAASGRGAWMDGRPIHIDEGTRFRKRMIGVPTSMDAVTQRVVGGWLRREDLILRNTGSAAYHLALVACGALAAAYGFQCKVWDIAAGAVLVREAGGVLTDLNGEPMFPWRPRGQPDRNMPCLAGAPDFHRTLLADFEGQDLPEGGNS